MPYIEEIVIAGKTKEVSKKQSYRFNKKGGKRGKKVNPTPEEVKRVNERNAETKLRRLLNTNFGYQDIHLVLTYRREARLSQIEAKKELEKFLRRLRTYFKKQDQVLKYIAVTEYKGKAIHHHLVISSMDTRDLCKMWLHGKARPTYLDDSGQYGKLASYLIKETSKTFREEDNPNGSRWTGSKNLDKPKVKRRIVPRRSWTEEPKATKGYMLEKDSVRCGVHEVTGYPYQFYSMVKIKEIEVPRRKRNE